MVKVRRTGPACHAVPQLLLLVRSQESLMIEISAPGVSGWMQSFQLVTLDLRLEHCWIINFSFLVKDKLKKIKTDLECPTVKNQNSNLPYPNHSRYFLVSFLSHARSPTSFLFLLQFLTNFTSKIILQEWSVPFYLLCDDTVLLLVQIHVPVFPWPIFPKLAPSCMKCTYFDWITYTAA